MNERMNEWKNEWRNKWINERMNKINKGTNRIWTCKEKATINQKQKLWVRKIFLFTPVKKCSSGRDICSY